MAAILPFAQSTFDYLAGRGQWSVGKRLAAKSLQPQPAAFSCVQSTSVDSVETLPRLGEVFRHAAGVCKFEFIRISTTAASRNDNSNEFESTPKTYSEKSRLKSTVQRKSIVQSTSVDSVETLPSLGEVFRHAAGVCKFEFIRISTTATSRNDNSNEFESTPKTYSEKSRLKSTVQRKSFLQSTSVDSVETLPRLGEVFRHAAGVCKFEFIRISTTAASRNDNSNEFRIYTEAIQRKESTEVDCTTEKLPTVDFSRLRRNPAPLGEVFRHAAGVCKFEFIRISTTAASRNDNSNEFESTPKTYSEKSRLKSTVQRKKHRTVDFSRLRKNPAPFRGSVSPRCRSM